MATEAIYKLQPHRTLSLRRFDRRGAAASITAADAGGFTVSGVWSDLADFAVLTLFDADDDFGHLQTTKYLPDFDMTGVVLDYDCAIVNGVYPGSNKFPSVPWGNLSWQYRHGCRSRLCHRPDRHHCWGERQHRGKRNVDDHRH